MGNAWYCSVDCFVKASRDRFASLTCGRNLDMPHKPRITLGSIMLSKGYLTEEEYRSALMESRLSGEAFETTVVRMQLVDEWQLASARAMQWGYPVLGRDRISQSADADLPPSLMKAFSAVPLHTSKSAKRILIGFVYRVEHSLLHSLEQATGYRVDACFITPTDLHYQMERFESAQDRREIILDDLTTAIDFGKFVGGVALEITAREVSLSRCQDYVWMRLSGKRQSLDVLFRGKQASGARRCYTFVETGEDIRAIG
jgi:hypothetical protein